jgi:hypothetical protein
MMLRYGNDEKIGIMKGEILLLPAILDHVEIFPDKKVKCLEVFIS